MLQSMTPARCVCLEAKLPAIHYAIFPTTLHVRVHVLCLGPEAQTRYLASLGVHWY